MSDEPSKKKIFTVTELSKTLKGVIEENFNRVWVEGEISKYHAHPASGHVYLTIKDEKSILDGAIWRGARRNIRFEPKVGDQVLVQGKLSSYPSRSQYQIIVDSIEPKGLGALQAAFEQLKKKLATEGLFDQERKVEIPEICWNVGIVTSPTGAVIRDMIRTLNRRFPGLRVVLAPVAVQGDKAAGEIAKAINDFNEYGKVDVIIAGRGGGSLEDLWAFNEEVVARAIAESKIPIVSAVGHEPDFTIADFVADLRAATPTAAAELVAPERASIEAFIDDSYDRIRRETGGLIDSLSQFVDDNDERLVRGVRLNMAKASERLIAIGKHLGAVSPMQRIKHNKERLLAANRQLENVLVRQAENKKERLSNLSGRFKNIKPERWINDRRAKSTDSYRRLNVSIGSFLKNRKLSLGAASGKLNAYSPLASLNRGYSIVSKTNGEIIKSTKAVKDNEEVSIRLSDGSVKAVVGGKKSGKQENLF